MGWVRKFGNFFVKDYVPYSAIFKNRLVPTVCGEVPLSYFLVLVVAQRFDAKCQENFDRFLDFWTFGKTGAKLWFSAL